ncbi:outer membrane beta-barrel family protein [Portibacter lacus]|uniref:Outer membrane protein beta-barrel domain-containing protein n=1 Tax=Portibacter lacus TaxID=1099794 RepID=A0AA37WFL5_9BACT|nr:outer membrane beta-barrel family protein [Portibacter lacus]GLR16995.1 hypothetical protein GCM10007940_16100 [Portibacter lacus]
MKAKWILITTVLYTLQVNAQFSISGHVSNEDNESLPFTNVVVMSSLDSSFITGLTTDDFGNFEIGMTEFVNSYLEVSALGYKTRVHKLSMSETNYHITLELSTYQLAEVTVEAKKSLYELKPDRVIVNVGSIPSFGGDNALQVLSKSPGVLVNEGSGTINLNNKGEVLIMINNKISRIPKNILVSQLRSIRAENIEKIELIHQPSSKYDSDNSAGIIHIVLKSNDISGFNGNVTGSLGYGQKEKFNGSIGLNYRRSKLNFYGDISGYHSHADQYQVNHEREYEFEGSQFGFDNSVVLANYINRGVNGTIGMDYNLNKSTIIGVLGGFNVLNEKGGDLTSNSNFYKDNNLTSSTKNLFNIDNPKIGQFLNVNLFKTLSNNNSINFDIDRAKFSADNYGYFTSINESRILESNRKSTFLIYTIKSDYQQSFGANASIETGVKATLNNTSSISNLIDNQGGRYEELIDFRRDDYIKEVILAAYSSYKKKFSEDLEGEFGLRYEQYNYKLNTLADIENLEIQLRNPFPIIRLNYTIDSINSINVSFNRRTNRPGYGSLVAYQLFFDPTLYVGSNMTLRPAFTNSIRLSYKYKSILTSIEANRTNNAISYYNTVDKESGTQTSTPINFDKMESVIANVSFPFTYRSWFESNVTLTSGYYRVFDSSNRPLPFDENIFSHTIQMNNTFNLGKGWRANLGGRYSSPFISGDQFQRVGLNINAGIVKNLKNGSIVFNIQDATNTSGVIFWEYHQPELGIRTSGDNDFSERVFRLTYSTNFGDQKLKGKRNRVTGSQEERSRM